MIRSLREAGVLWRRNMLKLTRVPMLLFFSLFQPLLFLLLFSQVFSRLSEMPGFGYENYLQFLVPTIVGLTTLNSAFQSGMGMVNDIDDGLLDKFLIAPIRRSSILLGKVLADATRMALQALLILGFAYIMGARVETGILGGGLLILIAVLFGIAWAGISNVVALRTGNAELTMLIGILITFPVLFLSTGFMPQALLPDWLGTAAQFNPITYLINALRELVNEGWNWTAIWQALAVTAGLASPNLQREQEQLFRDHANARIRTVEDSLQHNVTFASSLNALLHSSQEVTYSEFRTFAAETQAGLEHPHLAAWAPRIPGEDRLATEQSLRKEQYPGFQFQEIGAEGRLVPAEPRDEYYPFTYITPSSTETNALAGLDLAAAPRPGPALPEHSSPWMKA